MSSFVQKLINPIVITNTCKNTTCINVIQKLNKSGILKATVTYYNSKKSM